MMLVTSFFHGLPIVTEVFGKNALREPLDAYEVQIMRSVIYTGLLGSALAVPALVTFADAVTRYVL